METTRHVNRAVLVILISLGLVLPRLSVAAREPRIEGLINVDHPDAEEAKVEVNLRGPMLSLLAKGIRERNPDGAEFLMSLVAAKVRVYDQAALGGKTFADIRKFYRQQMEKSEWETLARTQDKEVNVGVYSLSQNDVVSGLVILIENGTKKEFGVVNLAGKIDITKLSQLDKITGVNVDLPQFDFKKDDLPPEKQEQRKEKRQQAVKSFLEGNHYKAITILEQLEAEGINSGVDNALMALLYYSMGAQGKSYRYLGKLYDLQNEKALSKAFYEKSGEMEIENKNIEKSGK